MRICTLVLTIQFLSFHLIGQDINKIIIHINTNDGNNLPLSHVTIDNENHFIADEKGNISFSSVGQTSKVKISHIGYTSIDTFINLKTQVYHGFILIPNNYTIDPITISDSQKLIEKNNWWINDIILHEFGFLVSATERSKKYIYLFDNAGNQILKSKTDFKHSTIIKGLNTGHYHLMNEQEGQELLVSTDTILFLDSSPIKQYDKTVNRFKYSKSNYTVSEDWSTYNKKLTYSVIDNKTFDRKPFYMASDQNGYKTARKTYYEIIGMYNRAIDIDDPKDIDYGMKPPKILNIAAWKGDLFSLIINNSIHIVYHDYINFQCAKLKVSSIVHSDKFYILDHIKQKMSIYNLNIDKISEDKVEVSIPEALANTEFMMSDHENELILSSGDEYYTFDIKYHKFRPVSFETEDCYYPKREFVTNNQLYTLARKSMAKHKMYIHRTQMEEGHQ